MSDQVLIVGNGGVKNTKTYEENEELSGYVMDLQKFDNFTCKTIALIQQAIGEDLVRVVVSAILVSIYIRYTFETGKPHN
jgi:hypothetical protein